MLSIFDSLRDLNWISVGFRLLMVTLCGGLIGVERTYKRRAAGMRTHILICMGAAMTTLTSQYLMLSQHYYLDITRMGAKVITGISFIGAGTIIVTRRQQIKGLTTAAGLWGSAIVGLAIGAGFYEGGLLVTLLILITEIFFSKLEYYMLDTAPEVDLYVEFIGRASLIKVLAFLRDNNLNLLNIEITRREEGESPTVCAILSIRLTKNATVGEIVEELRRINGITVIEELRDSARRRALSGVRK